MFHNMKADIIYYKTATDFELEFNLCGCCRMRLLSDKMQDKKSFVHSLARAVSRSSVILIAGPLFGDEGSIKTVADAINTTTEIADNKTYGIIGEDQIQIIKGSIPLVNPEGYFGGCIIESGPQTMILLTDNKSIRKTIMQNLIHPYIEELYSNAGPTEQGESSVEEEILISENEDPTKDQEPVEEITEEPVACESDESLQEESIAEDITETAEDVIQNQPSNDEKSANLQSDIIMLDEDYDTDSANSYEDEEVDLYFEAAKPQHRKNSHYYNDYFEAQDYGEDYQSELKINNPQKNTLSISVLIISIILLLVVAILCYCIFIVPMQSGVSPVENLQEIFTTMFG